MASLLLFPIIAIPLSAENAHRSYLQVDYPAIGLLNRILQIIIVVITAIQLFGERTWAYSEVPVGTVNAFGGPGNASLVYSKTLANIDELAHCNNDSHTFQYSANFDYSKPECRYVVPEQYVFFAKRPPRSPPRLLARHLARLLARPRTRPYRLHGRHAILVGSLATDACPARWMPRHGTTLSCAQTSAHHAPHRNHTRRLVIKGTQQVQFVTMFLENTFHGYPCSNPFINAINGTCEEGGGTVESHDNGQCVCKISKTVYPLGVEEMVMSFEHTYQFPVGKFGLSEWKGSSTLDQEQVSVNPNITAILPSTIGGAKQIKEGGSVSQTVKEWLTIAGTSLDELNSIAGADNLKRKGPDGKSARLPFNRMTGMVVTVTMRYSNGDPSVERNQNIMADITASKQLLAWAGPGSERIHVQYPSGGNGAQEFHYIDRYSQGIVFDFQPTGRVYVFDITHVLNTFIAALVLLGFAATITDTVAFYALPNGHSKVLAAHRQVVVNKKQGFAELGMRTALAAKYFASAFDPDNNGIVEAEDIVRVLASVAGPSVTYKRVNPETGEKENVPMDCEKAHAIAIAILQDQHASADEECSLDSFTFNDFMRTQDNGTIPFPDFMEKVAIPKDGEFTPSQEERARCERAWQEGLRETGTKTKEKTLRRRNRSGRMEGDIQVSISD